MMVIVLSFDTAVCVLFTLQYYFFVCPIQFTKMLAKNPPTDTDGTEDGLSHHVKRKNLKGEDCRRQQASIVLNDMQQNQTSTMLHLS
jgi:hypothetical protein